jgi:hypothetical protein
MWLSMRRSVWDGATRLPAGEVVEVSDAVARAVIASGAGVPCDAPVVHREPVVEHRDPPKARRR